MKHLMLDIETLGPTPDGVITQIGACLFDMGHGDTDGHFKVNVSRDDCLRWGLRVHPDTEEWWASQPNEVFDAMVKEARPLESALIDFAGAYSWSKLEGVWTNAPTFDFSILRNGFNVTRVKCPWHYRQERDSRTLLYLAKKHSVDIKAGFPEREGTHHDALDDAVYQARVCSHLWGCIS
jgi:exodeoxyribonuclease VIII